MIQWTDEQIERAKKDFRVLVYMVWEAISLPEPTEIQLDMANVLANPPSDRMILEGYRGVAKSFLTCVLCVWFLWLDPTLKVQIVSANKEKADLNASFIKKIIYTLDFLSVLRLTSEDRTNGLRDTNNLFDVHGAIADISPSVKSVGITGQLTGSRADILISDDVEVPRNSATQIQRDQLAELVKEYDAILKPGGRIIYLGTPQCEASLYVELANRGYETVIYPVEYPKDDEERAFYGSRLSPLLARRYDADPRKWQGKPTDPKRFNEEEIAKRRLSYGRAGFMLQFMLNTSLSDANKHPLRVADFIVASLDRRETSVRWSWASGNAQRLKDIPCTALKGDFYYEAFERSPEVMPYTGTMMFIDPSGRGKDETAYAVTRFLNGYIFLVEVGGYRDGYSEDTLKALVSKAKFWGVNSVRIEPNFGDGMFTQLITPFFTKSHPCDVQESKSAKGQKEARIIDILEPTLSCHKLIVDPSVIESDYEVYLEDYKYSFIYQLTRLTRERDSLAHDDRVEAVAGAVLYWLEGMAINEEQVQDDLLLEKLDQWLDPDRGIFYVDENQMHLKKPSRNIKDIIENALDTFWKDYSK